MTAPAATIGTTTIGRSARRATTRIASSAERVRAGSRRRQGVELLDDTMHLRARFSGARLAQRLDAPGPLGQRIVLDAVLHPARVVAAAQVEIPGLVVYAVGHLQENDEVLRTQVQRAARTAEIEAAVLGQLARCVLAVMTSVLGAVGYRLDADRLLLRVA